MEKERKLPNLAILQRARMQQILAIICVYLPAGLEVGFSRQAHAGLGVSQHNPFPDA